jgi:hypothetical protein
VKTVTAKAATIDRRKISSQWLCAFCRQDEGRVGRMSTCSRWKDPRSASSHRNHAMRPQAMVETCGGMVAKREASTILRILTAVVTIAGC